MEKEVINLPEGDRGNFSGGRVVEYDGEIYNFIEDYPSHDCDGECHNIIWQRESDQKYFRFNYTYYNHQDLYEENLEQVFPEQIVKTIWK